MGSKISQWFILIFTKFELHTTYGWKGELDGGEEDCTSKL